MFDLKFGRNPSPSDERDFFLKQFSVEPLPEYKNLNWGYGNRFLNWGMLGNDEVGDCVIASRAHLTMLDTSVGAPATARFTTESVIGEYSAVTGYDPSNPDTDRGANMRVMCGYQRATGLKDADGIRHKIGAYVRVDPTLDEILRATWIFGGCAIGFSVPQSSMDQFNNHEIWDDVGDEDILGGHEVCVVGTMNYNFRATCVTWGRRQEMTKAFIHKYVDEAWAWVAPEILNTKGFWRGLDIDALNQKLSVL